MLERRRKNKNYDIVPGDEGDVDLELGEGVGGAEGQETGVVETDAGAGAETGTAVGKKSVTEELDNWDENADDEWEEADGNEAAEAGKSAAAGGDEDGKKRAD